MEVTTVTQIIISIADKEIHLTLEQLKALHNAIHSLNTTATDISVPWHPNNIYYRNDCWGNKDVPNVTPLVTCQSGNVTVGI